MSQVAFYQTMLGTFAALAENLHFVAEFISPPKVHAFISVGDSSVPNSVKRTQSGTKSAQGQQVCRANAFFEGARSPQAKLGRWWIFRGACSWRSVGDILLAKSKRGVTN